MQVAQGQVIVTVCALVQAAHLVSAHPAAPYASAQDGLGPLQLALVVAIYEVSSMYSYQLAHSLMGTKVCVLKLALRGRHELTTKVISESRKKQGLTNFSFGTGANQSHSRHFDMA